jgi:ferrous iron transport protein B
VKENKKLVFALAGNANVGKSVIFNHLTGLHQHIGNWPGKTVERAEGTLHFKGYTIDIIDLPGIYSLSTFSIEELISREFIALKEPDLVINVVDASVLERNLFFTLQLLELETPMIIALNQMDIAKRKGIDIDCKRMEKLLDVPVIPTVAIKGVGIYQLLSKAIQVVEANESKRKTYTVRYGQEIEDRITELVEMINASKLKYPARYTAIKLLEDDEEIRKEVQSISPKIVAASERLSKEIEGFHGHDCSTAITCGRYEVAGQIARDVQKIVSPTKPPLGDVLHNLTTHQLLGYPLMFAILLSILFSVFTFGDFFSGYLTDLFYGWKPSFMEFFGGSLIGELLWAGIIDGIIAGVTIAVPYIAPFYLMLYLLEDSGYLSRIAFLMDNLMHKIGLHGKAFIPLILGYGCNVPACLGCRIMETERERLLSGFVVTLVPCAAQSVIILGLIGDYVGIEWALLLYAFDLLVILILGRIAFKALPGEPTALIMEMPAYKVPHPETVVKQTWFRIDEFIKVSLPLIVAGSFSLKLLELLNLLNPIANLLSPVTTLWLRLPVVTGIALVFGVLRKELSLIMLSTLLGTTIFSQVLTPVQMMTFTIVTMFYIPCTATIAALIQEYGWKKALLVTVFEIVFAIALGGVASRILSLFM